MAMAMAVASPDNRPGSELNVPKVWTVDAHGVLAPLKAAMPLIPTPSDQGIQPQEGDDTRPPNALRPEKLNRIVSYSEASVGFSSSQGQRCGLPSSTSYDMTVEDLGEGRYGLDMTVTMDFDTVHPGESMVVWMKRAKQLINDARGSEVVLVDTTFYDQVNGQWVRIDTDIRFAAEAEAVAKSVMETDSGQTVGRVVSAGAMDDAKLGPVGERGRVVLSYRCEELYCYAEMGLGPACAEPRHLVPLAVHLPHAPLDNLGGNSRLSFTVRGPPASRSLDLVANVLALQHLRPSLGDGQDNVLLPLPKTDQRGAVEYSFSTSVLPPRPTCLLFWMSCSAAADGEWELVGGMQKLDMSNSSVALQRPMSSDEHFLRSPMPGLAPEVRLFRCTVTPRLASPPVDTLHVHTDVVITDASGSTRMSLRGGGHSLFGGGGGRTVRSEFNRQEERRFLRRLESIPLLVQSGALRAQDVWRQVFCVFDHSVREYWNFECKAGDVSAELVRAVQSLAQAPGAELKGRRGELGAEQMGATQLLDSVVKTLETLRRLEPGGATSFKVGADHVASRYAEEIQAHVRAHPKLWKTTFVNWDTDGGNNRGSCYDAVQQLRDRADVVGGFVMGIGAWVDQECATRLAKILRGPCVLSLDFPPDDAQDAIFRRDLHHWLQAIKTMPLTATVSAGSVPWEARHGTRRENAVDCLAAVVPGSSPGTDAQQPGFDLPDVSEMDHTKAALKGLSAGQPVVLYLMSRLPFDELARRLRVDFSSGGPAAVACADEQASGTMLAHEWMQVLSGRGCAVQRNSHSLVPRVQQLLEDSLSFNFNLPSTSGSTARLGRAKTDHRASVPSERQPKEPRINLTVEHGEAMDAPDDSDDDDRSLAGCLASKSQKHLFGPGWSSSQPIPSLTGAVPPGGGLFGAPQLGAAKAMGFGAPAAACAAAPMGASFAPRARGGAAPAAGKGGGGQGSHPSGGAFGGAAPQGGGLFGGAAPQGGGLFGGAAPQGGGLFGGAAPQGGGLFGGAARGKGGKGKGGGALGPFSGGHSATGPVIPTRLLKNSGSLSLLGAEGLQDDLAAALGRIVFLVKNLVASHGGAGAGPPPPTEDPLVGQLLGAAGGQGAGAGTLVHHHGFTCDGCSVMPIVGNRCRSITSRDFDLCSRCITTSPLVSEHAFVTVADPLTIVRHALRVVLLWLPVLPATTEVPLELRGVDLESLPRVALLAYAQQLFGVTA